MTDELILVFGCGVTFLALAGAWTFLRGRMLDLPALRKLKPSVEESRAVAKASV